VGVTVLYWKALYPDSCVVALEPDPRLLSMLRANCHGLSGVEFVEAAAWVEDTYLQFNASGGVSGHLSSLSSGTSGQATIDVKAVRLRNLLHEKVDLLKLDIEGAEVDVLADCASHLESVDRLFVEYHAFVNKPQRIGEFFQILDDAGFVVHVHPEMPSPKPFVKRECMNSKHHRLNVFASRADMPEVRFPLNAATT
jgi:FkbM family methyltransferase